MLYLYMQGTGYRNISILRLLPHAVKLFPSSFLPIFGIALFCECYLLVVVGFFLLDPPHPHNYWAVAVVVHYLQFLSFLSQQGF